jgi:hypothetical protein
MLRCEVCRSATRVWLRGTLSMMGSMLPPRRGVFALVFGARLRGCVGTNCPSLVRSRQMFEVKVTTRRQHSDITNTRSYYYLSIPVFPSSISLAAMVYVLPLAMLRHLIPTVASLPVRSQVCAQITSRQCCIVVACSLKSELSGRVALHAELNSCSVAASVPGPRRPPLGHPHARHREHPPAHSLHRCPIKPDFGIHSAFLNRLSRTRSERWILLYIKSSRPRPSAAHCHPTTAVQWPSLLLQPFTIHGCQRSSPSVE